MAAEQYTERLTLKEMNCTIGKNPFGYVFPQGDVSGVDKIEKLLREAGRIHCFEKSKRHYP